MKIGSYEVDVNNREKLYFPDDGISKGDLIDYYNSAAAHILPYLQERPLSLQRFPNGIDAAGFYQKEAPEYYPDWIDRVMIPVKEEGGETQPQVVCNHAAALVYLADQGTITPHTWLSRADRLNFPDKLIFDLDPSEDDFELVRGAAQLFRKLLIELELPAYVMTTGSRGLHICIPLDRRAGFDEIREFGRSLAEEAARRDPEHLTTAVRKAQREGKLFLDYLRNAFAQTSVPPFAVRAKAGAPVAVPLDWEELSDRELRSNRYHIKNIFRRLAQKDDPWKDFFKTAVNLKQAARILEQMKK